MLEHTQLEVLIVDDEAPVRGLVKAMVEACFPECRVTEAKNGLEAQQILHSGVLPTVLITDWHMPELNGYNLLSWLRTHPPGDPRCHLPVVMMSGDPEIFEPAGQAHSLLQSLKVGFLAKPHDLTDRSKLASVIRQAIQG